MTSNIEEARRSLLSLLEQQRRETRSILSQIDPQLVVHEDERAWRVRDVLGHLAAWNEEAARSLRAHANGGEYACVGSSREYDDYNGPAAEERKNWSLDEVWAEYEASHDQLRKAIETMPADRWHAEITYPWSERGTVEDLVMRMMNHEQIDHCEVVIEASRK